LYHNKQELIEKRDLAETKKDEVGKLEKRKEISDDEIKAKKKDLAVYNKELAADEQKIKELVSRRVQFSDESSTLCSQEAQINKNRPIYIKAKENSAHHQKKLDLAK
jgi:structural maintenance of chromosome 1